MAATANIWVNLFLILLKYSLLTPAVIWAMNKTFTSFQNNFSPYDVFVIPHERKKICETLNAKGYDIPAIEE